MWDSLLISTTPDGRVSSDMSVTLYVPEYRVSLLEIGRVVNSGPYVFM
jgi:hypothetical protein